MAYIRERIGKNGKVSFTATLRLKGHPSETKTFSRKTDAKNWIQSTESAIKEGRLSSSRDSKRLTLNEVIDRYLQSPGISSKTKENHRPWLVLWKKQLGNLKLIDITPARISETRDFFLITPTERSIKAGKEKFEDPDFGPQYKGDLSSESIYVDEIPKGYVKPEEMRWLRPH